MASVSGNNSTILDVILEKTANVEHESNQNKIHRILNEAIKVNSRRERQLRASTITVKLDNNSDNRATIEKYVDEWLENREQIPATIWQDKVNVYIQFADEFTKTDFIESVSDNNIGPTTARIIANNLKKPNNRGEHFERKPVRLEIGNVKMNLKIANIKKTLECITSASGEIEGLKEGKVSALTRSRNLYFRTNQVGTRHIFKTLDGAIPYADKALDGSGYKTKLYTKINAKPYQCHNCFTIGPHPSCVKGKLCGQCCKPGHTTKECQSKTKYCDNCKMRGHRAKDTHCPYYLNEVAKELRKMDLPLEYLEEQGERETLIKHLQLK